MLSIDYLEHIVSESRTYIMLFKVVWFVSIAKTTTMATLQPAPSSRPLPKLQSIRSKKDIGTFLLGGMSLCLFFSLVVLFDPTAFPEHPPLGEPNVFPGQSVAGSSKDDPIVDLLKDAKVWDIMTMEEKASLPSWHHVEDLYGDKVRIVGKERCDEFKKKVPENRRRVAVAGMFNTGTNLLDTHLIHNEHGVKNIWQVPWGKHRMAEVKYTHTADQMHKYNKDDVFPIVIVRDPLSWMQSMCHNRYSAHWRHGPHHCPNLVPTEEDRKQFHTLHNSFRVNIRFDENSSYAFNSLAHLWSEWHQQYLDAEYPLMFGTLRVVSN